MNTILYLYTIQSCYLHIKIPFGFCLPPKISQKMSSFLSTFLSSRVKPVVQRQPNSFFLLIFCNNSAPFRKRTFTIHFHSPTLHPWGTISHSTLPYPAPLGYHQSLYTPLPRTPGVPSVTLHSPTPHPWGTISHSTLPYPAPLGYHQSLYTPLPCTPGVPSVTLHILQHKTAHNSPEPSP